MSECIYEKDGKCMKFTTNVVTSYCYGKDYPCRDREISNAMKIRSMTDEELAKWLNHMQADAYNRGMLEDWIVGYPNNYYNWLDWLREEADHD